MPLDLESIGLNQAELQERVIERLCDRLLETIVIGGDDDEQEHWRQSPFGLALDELLKNRLDAAVNEIAEQHVLPNVKAMIDGLKLTECNKWGEKKGQTFTFTEYLAHRAEVWMNEEVDFDGKSKAEGRGYSWSGRQTRLACAVHKYLHNEIENAMKTVIADGNTILAGALLQTCKTKMAEIAASLKVTVGTK
jgi:hypothetical protein